MDDLAGSFPRGGTPGALNSNIRTGWTGAFFPPLESFTATA